MRWCLGAAFALAALNAWAAVPIAFVAALSGPDSAVGREQRDGFLLAVAQGGGRLGGVDVRVSTFDDGGRSENASRVAAHIVASGAQYVAGLTDSQAAVELHRLLQGRHVLMLSSAAGPLALARRACAQDFFSVAPADDAVHENAGAIAQARRYAKAVLVVPPGSRELIEAAFKRQFLGDVEVAAQTDDAPVADAIASIRKAHPDVVYVALRKDAAKRLLDAYDSAGLFHRIPVVVAHSDPDLIESIGSSIPGATVSVRWAPGDESERSSAFVEAFSKRYGRAPSVFAAQGYDSAQVLAEAFRAGKGKPSVESVRHALVTQRVDGVAGGIRLAANGFPAADWHAWEIFSDAAGSPYLVVREGTMRERVVDDSGRCAAR